MQQDQTIFHVSNHFVRVSDEVWRQVTAVELHAFNNVCFSFQTFVFFNSDNTFVANTLHSVCDLVADRGFAVCGNCANLCNFCCVFNFAGHAFDVFNNVSNRKIDTALQIHRVHASGNRFQTFANDRLSQNSRSSSTVACCIVSARCNFFNHLRAHVLELVFQFDLFSHCNTVFGDAWCAERFVDNHVTTFRAEGHFYSVCQNINTGQHTIAGVCVELYVFCSHDGCSL